MLRIKHTELRRGEIHNILFNKDEQIVTYVSSSISFPDSILFWDCKSSMELVVGTSLLTVRVIDFAEFRRVVSHLEELVPLDLCFEQLPTLDQIEASCKEHDCTSPSQARRTKRWQKTVRWYPSHRSVDQERRQTRYESEGKRGAAKGEGRQGILIFPLVASNSIRILRNRHTKQKWKQIIQ